MKGVFLLFFETLNERGLKLTAVELLKNRLFAVTSPNNEIFLRVKYDWKLLQNSLGDGLDDYIRYMYTVKYGKISKRGLYKKLREEILGDCTPQEAKEYLDDLIKYHSFYRSFTESSSFVGKIVIPVGRPNHELHRKQIAMLIGDIRRFGFKMIYIFLIAGIKKYGIVDDNCETFSFRSERDTKKFIQYIKVCRNAFIRNQHIMNDVRTIESEIHNLVQTIMTGEMTYFRTILQNHLESGVDVNITQIYNGMSCLNDNLEKFIYIMSSLETIHGITDEHITSALKIYVCSKDTGTGKIMLRLLENSLRGYGEEELYLNDPNITLEHILPERGYNEELWSGFTPEEHSECKNKLGNLILLGRGINEGCDSWDYCVKREFYGHSVYKAPKYIHNNYEAWNPSKLQTYQDFQADSIAGIALALSNSNDKIY